jgi:hypothetical protein
MAYEFLVESTNRLFAMQAKASRVSPGDLAEALSIVCKSAGQLARDKPFVTSVDAIDSLSPDDRRELRRVLHDTEHFCSVFLSLERGLFEKAGFNPLATDLLLEQVENLRETALDSRLTSDQLRRTLEELEFTSCERASTLIRWQANDSTRANTRAWIGRLGTASGGLGMIALNAGLMIPTLGLTAPQAVVSSSIGGSMVALGTKAIWKDRPPRA